MSHFIQETVKSCVHFS